MIKIRFFALVFIVSLLAGCGSSQPTTVDAEPEPTQTTETDGADSSTSANAESRDDNDAKTSSPKDEAPTNDAEDAADQPTVLATATETAPEDWQHRNLNTGDLPGISTDEAYSSVLNGREPKQTVVVAVIDSGIDIEHEDLDDRIWTNEDEIPDNGVDDDNNGYVDDIHGWNFLGGPNGENIDHAPMELTRMVRSMGERFKGLDSTTVSEANRADYERYLELRDELDRMRESKKQEYSNVRNAYEAMSYATQLLTSELSTDTLSISQVRDLNSPRRDLQRARDIYVYFAENDLELEDIKEYRDSIEEQLQYGYDLSFNPRPIVGDNPDDLSERFYGNNDITGPDAFHGTHVAGIIAAERDNGIGMDGVAHSTEIMVIRAVPNGDERDKDVANAIRYAAENGAHIINMSFGKDYSPEKQAVDAAVRYADSLGVLMIHAAGNDGANVDTTDNFPSSRYLDGGTPDGWITVGASSWEGGSSIVASFSNYGAERVDLFAPGVDIYSTTPDQSYERSPGTSMAAPMVSGVAALVMAYHPDLSASEVRSILLSSTTQFPDLSVTVPGGENMVPFSSLSSSGGIVNVAAALRAAAEHSSGATPNPGR